jgi:hypothetical protein
MRARERSRAHRRTATSEAPEVAASVEQDGTVALDCAHRPPTAGVAGPRSVLDHRGQPGTLLTWAAALLGPHSLDPEQVAQVAELISRSGYWSPEERARILDADDPGLDEFMRRWREPDSLLRQRGLFPRGPRGQPRLPAPARLFHLLWLWTDVYAPRNAPAPTPAELDDLACLVALIERRDDWPAGTHPTAEHLRQEYRDLARLPDGIWVDDLDVTELLHMIGPEADSVLSGRKTRRPIADLIGEWGVSLASGRPWPVTAGTARTFHPVLLHPALGRVGLDDELTASQATRIERALAEVDRPHAARTLASLPDDQKEIASLWLGNIITQLEHPALALEDVPNITAALAALHVLRRQAMPSAGVSGPAPAPAPPPPPGPPPPPAPGPPAEPARQQPARPPWPPVGPTEALLRQLVPALSSLVPRGHAERLAECLGAELDRLVRGAPLVSTLLPVIGWQEGQREGTIRTSVSPRLAAAPVPAGPAGTAVARSRLTVTVTVTVTSTSTNYLSAGDELTRSEQSRTATAVIELAKSSSTSSEKINSKAKTLDRRPDMLA